MPITHSARQAAMAVY